MDHVNLLTKRGLIMVPEVGLEPTHVLLRRILNPLRLPISPPGQLRGIIRMARCHAGVVLPPPLFAHFSTPCRCQASYIECRIILME